VDTRGDKLSAEITMLVFVGDEPDTGPFFTAFKPQVQLEEDDNTQARDQKQYRFLLD